MHDSFQVLFFNAFQMYIVGSVICFMDCLDVNGKALLHIQVASRLTLSAVRLGCLFMPRVAPAHPC